MAQLRADASSFTSAHAPSQRDADARRPDAGADVSHEVYLSRHVTRDSMVENMLKSFNNLPHGQGPTYSQPDTYHSSFQDGILRPNAAPQGPFAASSPPQRRPSGDFQHPNLQPTRVPLTTPPSPGGAPKQAAPSSWRLPRHEKKQSKGSNASTESVSRPFRWARSRSNSIDVDAILPQPDRPKVNTSILARARPVPLDYHIFADTPISPTDTRSLASSSAMRRPSAPFTNAAPLSSSASFNNIDTAGRNQSFSLDPFVPVSGALHTSADRQADPLPQQQRPVPNAPEPGVPVKERSGFFRRVFGSAPKPSAPQPDARRGPPQLPPLEVGESVPSSARKDSNPPSLQPSAPLSGIPPPNEDSEIKEVPSQTLNKKTSFFRRRRKTVADKETAVPASQDVPPQPRMPNQTVPPSNSLQSALLPFLDGAQSPTALSANDPSRASGLANNRNIFSFGSTSSSANEGLAIKTHRPGTASWIEQGSTTSKIPSGVPRPSTSVKRPNEASHPGARASLVGSFDHLSLRSNSRDIRSPVPSEIAYVSARASPMPNDPGSPKSSGAELPPMAAPNTSPKCANKSSAEDANSAVSRPGNVVRTGSLPVLPSDRPTKPERLYIRGSEDGGEHVRSVVATAGMQTPHDVYATAVASSTASPIVSSDFHSASSLPLVQVEGKDAPISPETANDPMEPTAADIDQARQILAQQDDPHGQAKVAAILHEPTREGERVRRAYMALYDFSGLPILLALRDLCGHLALKGESQQVDRILSSFAQRWCDCNPSHGFKSADVVHTICYSILLLNTDLHTADVENKMSRSQFIKNAIPTIRSVAEDSAEDTIKASSAPVRAPIPWRDTRSPSPIDGQSSERPSIDLGPRGNRLSIRPSSGRPVSGVGSFTSPSPYDVRSMESATNLVNAPFDGSTKGWEAAVEAVLRDIYASIRSDRLPLHGSSEVRLQQQTSSQSLSIASSGMRRSGSILSKTPSEPHLARPQASGQGSRWGSKSRSTTRLYPPSSFASSRSASRTSLEEQGMWSPSGSSTWSKSYYGQQTQTTMSSDSLSSRMTQQDDRYQQSIGFANALSHAIIREEGAAVGDDEDEANAQAAFEIEDGLELAGAPWAKEGIVKHKHHLETTDKKAKDRNWNECFAVVEKGWMRLFAFNSKSVRNAQKGKVGVKGAIVGGGNWTENAEALGAFMLRQTIANALPPPGYSKQRPHVFALSLPNGAVHLFHVGTAEIAKEFVSSANYWSARLSKEPLVGGVSNVEYGWSDAVINSALVPDSASVLSGMRSVTPSSGLRSPSTLHSPTHSRGTSVSTVQPRMSASGRGSTDTTNTVSMKKLPADRINLAEWTPPQQSLMASHLPELEQLEALRRYVRGVEDDLGRHNELRGSMLLAFSQRSANGAKAMANWERKSSYLLREIVKFRTYIDSLTHAQTQKEQIAKERKEYEAEKKRIMAEGKAQGTSGSVPSSGGASLDLSAETIEAIKLAQKRAEQEQQGS